MIVLDTCALLWHTLSPENDLTDRATAAIEKAHEILISSISIWEIGIKQKKKDLFLPITLENFVNRIKQSHQIRIVAIDEEILIRALNLEWNHKDPADRIIVATAEKFGIPLVTADTVIRQYYPKSVW
jgi:PIN domain nuclease of toxin-antitoxin system